MGRADPQPLRVPRIALTGGIASGKSTVAQLFTTLGARLIDTDLLARELVEPGMPALAEIAARFGAGVLTPDGHLDRARLRDIVFADPAARTALEAILHPRIRALVEQRSRTAGGPYQLIAIPLLVEGGTQQTFDRVLVVDCDPEDQLRRLMVRDRMDAATAARIMAAQASRAQRLSAADDVIRNDGDIAALAEKVETLHKAYLDASGYAK